MKKFILISLVFVLFLGQKSFSQKEFDIKGVIVPRTIDFQGHKLELNGFGTRSKLWFDVYVQALYLTSLSQDAKAICDSETEMGIRIQIISSLVTSKKLSKALNKGLIKSVGEENLPKIQSQADQLEKLIGKEITKEGDAFNLIYNPIDFSISVYKNDKLEGKIIGLEFKKAFFGIWLSDNPVDADLKNDLLGK
ncbi:MAG: chalcone isomerase family protein [Flavobacterium sp.]|nr:chalcone isomerase family protein [Flavobacterium sp.]